MNVCQVLPACVMHSMFARVAGPRTVAAHACGVRPRPTRRTGDDGAEGEARGLLLDGGLLS